MLESERVRWEAKSIRQDDMPRTLWVLSMSPPSLVAQVVDRRAGLEQMAGVRSFIHGREYCGEQYSQLAMRNGVEVFRFDLFDGRVGFGE